MTVIKTIPLYGGNEWWAIEKWLESNIGPFGLNWGYLNSGLWFRYPADATLTKITLGL